MIMLGHASPATLDAYAAGIKQLMDFNPNHWGIVYCADEIIRSEVWASTAESLQDDGEWPEDLPWDKVIQMTTYGGAHITQLMSHWWYVHVTVPCGRSGSAISLLQTIEGTNLLPMPDGYTSASPNGPRRAPKKNRPSTTSSSGGASSWDPRGPVFPPWQDKPKGGKGKGKGGQKGKDKGGKDKGGKGKTAKSPTK